MPTKLIAIVKPIGYSIFFLLTIFVIYCGIIGKLDDKSRTQAANDAGLGMQVRTGELCRNGICEPALLLTGYMDDGFARRFLDTAAKQIDSVKWICINSPGGRPKEGISLADYFQQLEKQTCVVPIVQPSKAQEKSICASACAFAFAGGLRRILSDEQSLGIHRSFIGDGVKCIPCNFVTAKILHNYYETMTQVSLNQPFLVKSIIEKSANYPAQYDANPYQVHWVSKGDFLEWGIGVETDFDSTWRFVEA